MAVMAAVGERKKLLRLVVNTMKMKNNFSKHMMEFKKKKLWKVVQELEKNPMEYAGEQAHKAITERKELIKRREVNEKRFAAAMSSIHMP